MIFLYLYLAASFAVLPATIREGYSSAMACVQMTTDPPEATLANEVLVMVSTMDGTGIFQISQSRSHSAQA